MGRRRTDAGAALRAALVLLLLALPLAAPAPATAGLGTRVTAILSSWGLAGPGSGVRVVVAANGRTLYTRSATTRLTPASNTKLVTSATALARLGAGHRFRTELYVPATPPDGSGVLRGNVYLKGYGDPTLATPAYARRVFHRRTASVADFVPALKALGVKRIVGRVIGDESYFDARRSVSTWAPGDTQWCGPLSALSLNEGFVDGRRVAQPAVAAARTLTKRLEKAGVAVSGSPGKGRVPSGWVLAYTEYSPSLATVLKLMNKPSDNFIAEEIAKGLGARFRNTGTTAAGVRVESAFLRSSGVSGTAFRLHDGSGLSHGNRLTAGSVVRLLRVMWRRSYGTAYYQSLAVAGRDGTLSDRMRGTSAQGNVHAKTGTLTGASCLSGYATAANGRRVVFSILMNRPGLSIYAAHGAQDAIAVAIASSRP